MAQFVIASLDEAFAQNTILEVGGPQALSPLEVVQIFEEVKGQKFSVEQVPEEALQAQKAAATDAVQESFVGLMLEYANGDAIDMQATLRSFPLALTTVKDYAKRVLTPS